MSIDMFLQTVMVCFTVINITNIYFNAAVMVFLIQQLASLANFYSHSSDCCNQSPAIITIIFFHFFGKSWKCYHGFFILLLERMGIQKLYLLLSPVHHQVPTMTTSDSENSGNVKSTHSLDMYCFSLVPTRSI